MLISTIVYVLFTSTGQMEALSECFDLLVRLQQCVSSPLTRVYFSSEQQKQAETIGHHDTFLASLPVSNLGSNKYLPSSNQPAETTRYTANTEVSSTQGNFLYKKWERGHREQAREPQELSRNCRNFSRVGGTYEYYYTHMVCLPEASLVAQCHRHQLNSN